MVLLDPVGCGIVDVVCARVWRRRELDSLVLLCLLPGRGLLAPVVEADFFICLVVDVGTTAHPRTGRIVVHRRYQGRGRRHHGM